MPTTLFLSHFTPSLTEPRILEEMFVQRNRLASNVTSILKKSVRAENRSHFLFIGPRGIGKSHLIALLHHRLSDDSAIDQKCEFAWLREEEWGVTCQLDILLRILRTLVAHKSYERFHVDLESVYELTSDEAESFALDLLRKIVKDKTLLLFMENFDEIVYGMKKKELQKFIQFITTDMSICVLASAQRNPFSRKDDGLEIFHVEDLKPLSIEEAQLLLTRIARIQGNSELADFLSKSEGRYRVEAVHHLASGNHRIYVIFSQFLTRQTVEELIEPLSHTIDELTPYYQSKMQWISPHQRKIVEFLCDRRHAVTVKEIAQRCFMTQQSASSQLKELRDKGYVDYEQIGRESYYEIREPLMRLCLEAKKNRGKPIRLFVEFLRSWYSPEELEKQLAELKPHQNIEREYLQYALETVSDKPSKSTFSDISRALSHIRFFGSLLPKQDATTRNQKEVELKKVLLDLKAKPTNTKLLIRRANLLADMGDYAEAVSAYERAISKKPSDLRLKMELAECQYKLGSYEKAIEIYESVLALLPNDADAKRGLANAFFSNNELSKAAALLDDLIASPESVDHDVVMRVIIQVSEAPKELPNIIQRAREDYPSNKSLMILHVFFRFVSGEWELAEQEIDTVIDEDPDNEIALTLKTVITVHQDRYEDTLSTTQRLKEINPKNPAGYFYRARILLNKGKLEEALVELNAPSEFQMDWDIMMLRSYLLLQAGQAEDAIETALNAKAEAPIRHELVDRTPYSLTNEESVELFEFLAEHQSRDLYILSSLVKAYTTLSNTEKALDLLDKLATDFAENPHVHFRYAALLTSRKRYARALIAVDNALRINPSAKSARLLKAEIMLSTNQAEGAMTLYEELHADYPSDHHISQNKISAMFLCNEIDAAINLFSETLSTASEDDSAWRLTVGELLERNKLDAAISCVRVVQEKYSPTNETKALLAVCRSCINWEDNGQRLQNALSQISDDHSTLSILTRTLIKNLMIQPKDRAARVEFLSKVFADLSLTNVLGVTFLRTLDCLPSTDELGEWYQLWFDQMKNDDRFDVPLRIARSLTLHIARNDKKPLFELPIEEREVANQILESLDFSGATLSKSSV